jgi:voltage-gated potassium channel Kch
MLYLSATTITTLGFGDIVPLTTPARLAISVEAVTGILLMGRFLNAVAKEK